MRVWEAAGMVVSVRVGDRHRWEIQAAAFPQGEHRPSQRRRGSKKSSSWEMATGGIRREAGPRAGSGHPHSPFRPDGRAAVADANRRLARRCTGCAGSHGVIQVLDFILTATADAAARIALAPHDPGLPFTRRALDGSANSSSSSGWFLHASPASSCAPSEA